MRIWKNRNLYIFQGKPWSSKDIVQSSVSSAIQLHTSSQEVPSVYLGQASDTNITKERVYLNIDGAVQLDSGLVATGGLVRDKEGNWIVGFHRFLGNCSVFDAELWGKLAQRRGFD
ncbi:hypothetical protein J1N35_019733 [Gossypium stocksii]|uniref:RNase H type-1 domain-containing protein n=1 Tax=Gossypium stocksii TaxID=47602 RepID=A0A9D4A069_9ROSI|nr:hypothetical protein J1N35_019733 [Gossypium stocksii]